MVSSAPMSEDNAFHSKCTLNAFPDLIAKTIAGDKAPPVLPQFISFQRNDINAAIMEANYRPTRTEQNEDLDIIIESLAVVVRKFKSTFTREVLAAAAKDRRKLNELLKAPVALLELSKTAKELIPRNSRGQIKAGRGKEIIRDRLSPKAICAAFIVEIWQFCHEDLPGPQTRAAAAAAQYMWMFVSLRDERWGNDVVNSWRHHFKTVLNNPSHSTLAMKRMLWRRTLEQAVQRGRVPWHGFVA